MSANCAAIDFGTNTARLLIAEHTAGGIRHVCVERVVVRLGGGFTDECGLSVDAQERGLSCLRRFSKIIADHGVTQVVATATSAVRDAVNGGAFVESVFQETGIRLVVITGDDEARLTLSGVLSGLDTAGDSLVILDVGGGSTEFTVSRGGMPVFIRSMPIGVVRLAEGFVTSENMVERIRSALDQLEQDLFREEMTILDNADFVGTAGTATTIAAIQLEMEDYDYRKVNNFVVQKQTINEIFALLSKLSPSERLSVKGLEKGREDLIIAGMLIITAVMERFGFRCMKVSDFGLLEGLALSITEPGR
ncbi:MAG: exopolyphosphatase [Desulfuromonadaceae bacterium]|nr:exopolyphosphatase [Desulfuromonadaceae bacterium]MDD5105865.1 exopolyphosphatase [Desulfuromonadaceae bacterium]